MNNSARIISRPKTVAFQMIYSICRQIFHLLTRDHTKFGKFFSKCVLTLLLRFMRLWNKTKTHFEQNMSKKPSCPKQIATSLKGKII